MIKGTLLQKLYLASRFSDYNTLILGDTRVFRVTRSRDNVQIWWRLVKVMLPHSKNITSTQKGLADRFLSKLDDSSHGLLNKLYWRKKILKCKKFPANILIARHFVIISLFKIALDCNSFIYTKSLKLNNNLKNQHVNGLV